MSPQVVQSVVNAQIEDRLRSAERRRLAAQARALGSAPGARSSGRRFGLRPLRVVFG